MQQPAAQLIGGLIKELGLIPHDQPGGPLVANLAAFWQQISPIAPVLPTVPAYKSCAVYNLAFEAFHGMEEVIGSIPIDLCRHQACYGRHLHTEGVVGSKPLYLWTLQRVRCQSFWDKSSSGVRTTPKSSGLFLMGASKRLFITALRQSDFRCPFSENGGTLISVFASSL